MKIICIGKNYTEHIKELDGNVKTPENPVVFLKPDSAVLLKNEPFFIPEFSNEIHYEVEILVKINRLGKHIEEHFAHKYFNEIGLGIDFTARDLQKNLKEKGLPWEKCKAFDRSAVIGDFINKNKLPNIENLTFHLTQNDTIVQKGNTNEMLFKINHIISYISQFFTLKIGDVIFTGTPPGVGRVNSGDKLEGFILNKRYFSISVK